MKVRVSFSLQEPAGKLRREAELAPGGPGLRGLSQEPPGRGQNLAGFSLFLSGGSLALDL